jgi:SP family myo-inositol transporter-like MFS transporter 13
MDSDANSTKLSLDDKAEATHQEHLDENADDSIEMTDPGKTVWLIACTVSMGGFLFGQYPP